MEAENAKMELAHKNNALMKAETDVKISKEIIKKKIYLCLSVCPFVSKKRQNSFNRLGKHFFVDLA